MSVTRRSTILGGLPVFVTVSFGKDADTPNGPGEYWAEVDDIRWVKKDGTPDGTPGASIPQKVWDRAEKYDPYFCSAIEGVQDELAYEDSERRRLKEGRPEMAQLL